MKRAGLILLAIFLMGTSAGASGSDGTESTFSFGAGARELALGGAAVTDPADATSVFWNPSWLTLARRLSVTGMHSELLVDGAVYQYLGVVVPTLDLGAFSFGLFRQSVQDIERRDRDNLYLGEFDDSQLRFYLGYGRSLGDFQVGASLCLDHQAIDAYRATSSPGLTLAASHRFHRRLSWLDDFRLSAVARDLLKPGIKLADETYRYPTVLELSASALVELPQSSDHTLRPHVTLRKTESIPLRVYAGLEYTYKGLLQLRGGVRQGNLSFGAGINMGFVSFDYALVDRDLDFVHLFALTGSFGLSVDERRKSRAERQEADFRQAMNAQMAERNLALIEELLVEGRGQLKAAQYEDAAGSFDRLVFLARSAELDDTEYQALLDSALELQHDAEISRTLQAAVDSAGSGLAAGDYLSARHHALRAMGIDSTYGPAMRIFEQADQTLKDEAERGEFVSEQVARVDSLIDSRQLDQAELIVGSLCEIAPNDDAVVRRVTRLELEKLRLKLADMESQRADTSGQTLGSDMAGPASEQSLPVLTETEAKTLTVEEQARISALYKEAKLLFNNGDIRSAVKRWEIVANQAPEYLSVKEFLVKAYRFLGLELYGQKQRAEAIAVWKKALALDPDNHDVAEYIKRAETQMKKLEELAHEQS